MNGCQPLQKPCVHVRVAGASKHAPGQALNLIRPQELPHHCQHYVKPLHQITLPPAMTTKLTPPVPPRCVPCNEQIFQKILPDPAKLKDWAEDLATLYLAATLSYTLKKVLLSSVSMKDTAKTFCVKLTALRCCINGHKYMGGSKKKPDQ